MKSADEFRSEPTKGENPDGSARLRSIGPRHNGVFRIYFNSKAEFSFLAAIGARDGSWELLVHKVKIAEGVPMESYHNLDAKPGVEPCWWLEGTGEVQVIDNIAYITQRGSHG